MAEKTQKPDLKKIAQQLVDLTVLQVNDLNQILKDDYGLEAAAMPVAAAGGAQADDQKSQEAAPKKQFDVLLKDCGSQKVAVIKAIKDLTDLPLGEAKALVDGAPKNIKESVAKEEAENMKTKLEEVGATVELV